MNCICGLKKDYSNCCGAFVDGEKIASTPEKLMRSRYCAFVKQDWQYVANTSTCQDLDELKNSQNIEWLKLDIIKVYENIVEFKAYYKDANFISVLHERSSFIQEDGMWKYNEGELFNSTIQRNESCPCGSGKKYKKCCSK